MIGKALELKAYAHAAGMDCEDLEFRVLNIQVTCNLQQIKPRSRFQIIIM